MKEAAMNLGDGRKLSYISYGNPAGQPVLFFHGSFGSRYEAGLMENQAVNNDIHLISVDRPGYGLSDKRDDRSIRDWVQDVEELLNHLNLEKVDVIGASGGAPYALVCADELGHLLEKVAVVCGLVPVDTEEGKQSVAEEVQMLIQAAQSAPEPLRQKIEQVHRNPEAMVNEMKEEFTDFDKSVVTTEQMHKVLAALKEGTRCPEEIVHEHKLYGQPWGINVNDIKVPVYFWHGENDATISLEGAKAFAAKIPGAQFELIEGAGHIGSGVVGGERALRLFAKSK